MPVSLIHIESIYTQQIYHDRPTDMNEIYLCRILDFMGTKYWCLCSGIRVRMVFTTQCSPYTVVVTRYNINIDTKSNTFCGTRINTNMISYTTDGLSPMSDITTHIKD